MDKIRPVFSFLDIEFAYVAYLPKQRPEFHIYMRFILSILAILTNHNNINMLQLVKITGVS